MTEQEQINALKAQVNRFRKIPSNIDKDNYDEPTFVIQNALSLTSDQCLAEVKANAIRAMQQELPTYGAILDDGYGEDWFEVVKHSDIVFYVNKLQEQAK